MTNQIDITAFNKKLQAIEQLIARQELRDAAERLNALVRTAPNHPVPYILGTRLAEAANNPPAARKSAERAVQCAPDWPEARIELAAVLARQNASGEALQHAVRATELAPEDIGVLTRAIDIAHGSRDFAVALPWLRKAITLRPDDGLILRALARNLAHQGQYDEALTRFDALLEREPDDMDLLADRVNTHFRQGNIEAARADADRLVAAQPDNTLFRFWHQRVNGQTPSTQPDELVEGLFDGYAHNFDMHLVRSLKYETPKRIAELIRELYPDLQLNVLDLGCGTGLLGVYLGRIKGSLVGVDLSEKMMEQAARHNVYDRFHKVNLVDALQETPDALYEVITACDVFVYVGALDVVIPGAARVLKPEGHLIFSCEQAEEDGPDFVLRDSVRYAHKASAVEALCRSAGLEVVRTEYLDLRHERNEPIRGFNILARKPA